MHELVAAASTSLSSIVATIALTGVVIPLGSPSCLVNRISLVVTISSQWLEFSTDFASGITALKVGEKFIAVVIMMAGASRCR